MVYLFLWRFHMDGILPLWKEKGYTSHDCVAIVRKLLKTKKVGHTGTLDPNVTGVLPLCIGHATKIAQFMTDAGKAYIADITLGVSTTTEDADGEVVEQKRVTEPIPSNKILEALKSHSGKIKQIPPMFSAVKVRGKKLYEYARQGIEVERPVREVTIDEITLLDANVHFDEETFTFRIYVKCSKGTYIRTLAVTIGEMLGYPAHMSNLVRVSSGGIEKEQCVTLEEIKEAVEKGTIGNVILPLEFGLLQLPKFVINDTLAKKVLNGAVLPISHFTESLEDGPIVIMNEHEKALAIYQKHPTKQHLMKPIKVLSMNE